MVSTAWSGSIAFGMVNIPVRLYKATEDRSIKLHQLHAEDGARVRYQRVCEKDGHVVEYEDIVKGYEYAKGENLALKQEELDAIPVQSTKVIEILQFANASDIPTLMPKDSYYVQPDDVGKKAYVLLCRAMRSEKKVAIGKLAFSASKEHLVCLRFLDGKLMIQTMHWSDEIRDLDVNDDITEPLTKVEVDTARQLVKAMTRPLDLSEYRDETRDYLMRLITDKVANPQRETPKVERRPRREVQDIMSALEKSVAAQKKRTRRAG